MSAKETKEKILKCTTELILERGGDISNVTIRTIAARAGIGVGLTNHYFESKEQLVEECIESVFAELFEMLTGEDRNGAGQDSLDEPGASQDRLAEGKQDSPSASQGALPEGKRMCEVSVPSASVPEDIDVDNELLSGLLGDDPGALDPELDNELINGLYVSDENEGRPEENDNQTVNTFEINEDSRSDEATRRIAGLVLDFLIRNEAIAKAALVRDAQNPLNTDYTARLTDAFAYAMVDKKKLDEIENNDRMTDRMKEQFKEHIINDQKLKAFMIMSSVKEALIRREVLKTSMDIDLQDDEQRGRYVDSLMELLY
ncbi:MAG: helix-turn-helix transcriptional regulator [Lachnospiraceae bacterium]|nr:helix-turn-helix transcriptional regulator [Lachnospiraceae bacterium]